MALTGFNATHVNPGEPLTAQAWNRLVDAVAALYGEHASARHVAIEVTAASGTLQPERTRMVARHATLPPVEAVRPSAGEPRHHLVGLRPGDWTLHVSSPGFEPTTAPLSIPVSGDPTLPTVTLTPAGVAAPNVFGASLTSAVATLGAAGIDVEAVYDTLGGKRFVADASAADGTAAVIHQQPEAGAVLASGAKVSLVISLEPDIPLTVAVPDLTGKTFAKAKEMVEAAGLKMGTSTTKTSGS